jgi:choline dehydrogenase-like flavoprotein
VSTDGDSIGRPRPSRFVGATATRPLTAPEWRLKRLLRAVSLLLAVLTAALVVVYEVGAIGSALREPPGVAGAVATGVLLAALCAFAAGDPRRRLDLVTIIVLSLAVAAVAQLAYLLAGTGVERPLGADASASDLAMVPLLALELTLGAAVAIGARATRRARGDPSPPTGHWPSGADAGLRPVLVVLGALAAVLAAAAAAGPFVDQLRELFDQPLLSAQAAAGAAAGGALCWYVAADIRERLPLAAALTLALLAGGLAALLLDLWQAQLGERIDLLGSEPTARTLLWSSVAASLLIAASLALLRRRAFRSRLQPQFLGPTEYRALMALADVIVQGPEEAIPPAEIAANVDHYFAGIRARRRYFHRVGLLAMQLHPALYLKAPFSELDEESRLAHLDTHFHTAVRLRRFPPEPLRRYVQVMLRMANQLTYIGYYNDPRSFPTVGYEPFPDRQRYVALEAEGKIPSPGEHPLDVARPDAVETQGVEADVCVIGSGAAGAILAYRLAEAGKSVVVLERGQYVEPREFNSDEVEMIGKLYADGVFQQSEDFRFTVLQGSCVGGSTVVNNAVSIPLPAHVLEHWNGSAGAGIDAATFRQSTEQVERWLRIHSQAEGAENPDIRLNPSAGEFLRGVERAKAHQPGFELDVNAVRANINGCLGCGYCNIGCRYGKKLSMLDTVLPWAQRDWGRDAVRIFAECEVRRIVTGGDGERRRATAVEAKLGSGRQLTVRAGKVVLAAGAVASPYLLQRSGIGKGLPIGRHASFNMGAPLTAEFDRELDAFDGLQISHVGLPPRQRGWVFETWWNPPVSQALNMPGWFDDHYENMRRYRRLMAVGVLVGTERNGRIGRALTGGPAVHYVPTAGDMRKLADGLIELGRILFAAGAKAVMLNAWEYYRFTSPNGLYELPAIMSDPSQVTLGTGHPQGGNAIGSDPGLSVVDPSFRVHGYSNLHVCDASVFPTSITVNPQLTVMSLAQYAAPLIADGGDP